MSNPQQQFAGLAGYQNVVAGVIRKGDVATFQMPGLANRQQSPADDLEGMSIDAATFFGLNIYRRIPVAKQGDIDHPPIDGCPGRDGVSDPGLTASLVSPDRALTYDDGKPPLANLPPAGLRGVAEVQRYGHAKYKNFNNYRKGMEHSRQISCAMRHLLAHMDGETNDPESGLPHIAHAACRIMFLMQNISDGVDIDDRFTRSNHARPSSKSMAGGSCGNAG